MLGTMDVDAVVVTDLVWHPVRIVAYGVWAGLVAWFAWQVCHPEPSEGPA